MEVHSADSGAKMQETGNEEAMTHCTSTTAAALADSARRRATTPIKFIQQRGVGRGQWRRWAAYTYIIPPPGDVPPRVPFGAQQNDTCAHVALSQSM